ncbi:triacylglycerol lipase [Streptomyces sp. NPDC091265]|uniref:triacylglycerol lipase n=1 Tax=unclassified Streptomyces TaxID=2593676 RepID=UPI00344D79D3
MPTVRNKIVPLVSAVLIGLVAALLIPPTASAAPPERAVAPRNPVIFVHGYNADPGVWGALRDDFKADGYADTELFSWGYDSSNSVNEVRADEFGTYVEKVLAQSGAAKVDVVAHSFGSLVTRWYVKFGGGTSTVEHWVSLGGPNHGTYISWACVIWDQACRDMSPGSYVQDHLADGDETPGPVNYATWWSSCDEVINPDASVLLSGAINHEAGCLDHNELLGDDGVSQGVRAFVAS